MMVARKPTILDQALVREVYGAGHKYLSEEKHIFAGVGGNHKFQGQIVIVRHENPDSQDEPRYRFLHADGTWHQFPIVKDTREPRGWFPDVHDAVAALAKIGIEVSGEDIINSARYG